MRVPSDVRIALLHLGRLRNANSPAPCTLRGYQSDVATYRATMSNFGP
jgi:hypothetical protein